MKNIFFILLTLALSLHSTSAIKTNKKAALLNKLRDSPIRSPKFSEVLRTIVIQSLGNQDASEEEINQHEQELKDKAKELINESPSPNDVVDYFVNLKVTPENYWSELYILIRVALFRNKFYTRRGNWGGRILDREQKINIDDSNYQELLNFDEEFNATRKNVINSFLRFLINYRTSSNLQWEEHLKRPQEDRDLRLSDFQYNSDLVNLLKSTHLYLLVKNELPKGIIHHYHWKAGFPGNAVWELIQKTQQELSDENKILFSLTPRIAEDKSNPGTLSTKTKYTIMYGKRSVFLEQLRKLKESQDELDDETKAINEYYQAHYVVNSPVNGGKVCTNFFNGDSASRNWNFEGALETRADIYAFNCNSILFDDALLEEEYENAVKTDYLETSLNNLSHIMLTENEIISVLTDNQKVDFNTRKSQVEVGVWTVFEDIFNFYGEIFKIPELLANANNYLFESLANQKIIGLENRLGGSSVQMEEAAQAHGVLAGNIKSGRKVPGEKLTKIFNDARGDPYGYDLYGWEDDPYNGARDTMTLGFLGQENDQKQINILINSLNEDKEFYPHAGETLNFPDEPLKDDDQALDDYINDNILHFALLPNVKRIGHGLAYAKNDLLLEIIKRKNISLENCPVSNQVLKYYMVRDNPVIELLRKGTHVSISPDDPGFWGYFGTGMDWLHLLSETDIKLSEIYLLLRYSVEHSALVTQEQRQEHYNRFKEQLLNFYNEMKNLEGTEEAPLLNSYF